MLNTNNKNFKKGFTLIEVLLVMVLVGILLAISLTSINMEARFVENRNDIRKTHVKTIEGAISQYRLQEGSYPAGLDSIYREICDPDATTCINFVDLKTALVPKYLQSIPQDPNDTDNTGGTGYEVSIDEFTNTIRVRLKESLREGGVIIAVNETFTPVSATGGIESTYTSGGLTYKVHKFTTVGTSQFTVTSSGQVEYLIVAGGGGGGNGWGGGGGGGAGGYNEGVLAVTPKSYSITVGSGGLGGGSAGVSGSDGEPSIFDSVISTGGGGGNGIILGGDGSPGGSGGGANSGGIGGDADYLSPLQGYDGGSGGEQDGNYAGGGGGGAGGIGSNGDSSLKGGDGGLGKTSSISGSSMGYAGGGGGGAQSFGSGGGSTHGGGPGGFNNIGTNATPNTGGGGGGGGGGYTSGGSGGSGIVIIRYPILGIATNTNIPLAPTTTITPPVNQIVTNGLMLHLDSDNTSSYPGTGTTWYDLSGNGNNGELVNSPTYNLSNPNFKFFQFVNDDFIRMQNNTLLDTQTPSVEVWVKTNATTQNGFWFEKGSVNTQYSLFQEGSLIQWRMNIAGITNLSTTTGTYMNTTSWYQVVGTYTSGTRRLYINGALVNSDNQSGTIATNAGGMSIGVYGGYNGGRGYYYNGNLAICRVYNRALTPAEIQQNFNATRGRFGL